MSGWRSGAGRPSDLLDDAIADPSAMLGTTRGRRTDGRFILILLGIVMVVFGVVTWHEASLRPAHRALPAPITGAVVVMPVGRLPDGLLDGLAGAYRDVYGVTLTVAAPFVLDPSLGGGSGPPVSAEAIANALRLNHRSSSLVVGVTAGAIATAGSEADGDLAQRFDGRAAVISTYPMVSMKTISRSTLFRKMLTRQLGFLVWVLPPSDNPYDLLYRSIENEIDLERVSDHL